MFIQTKAQILLSQHEDVGKGAAGYIAWAANLQIYLTPQQDFCTQRNWEPSLKKLYTYSALWNEFDWSTLLVLWKGAMITQI